MTVTVKGIVHFLFRQIFPVQFTSVVRYSAGGSFCGCKSVLVFFFPPVSVLTHRR